MTQDSRRIDPGQSRWRSTQADRNINAASTQLKPAYDAVKRELSPSDRRTYNSAIRSGNTKTALNILNKGLDNVQMRRSGGALGDRATAANTASLDRTYQLVKGDMTPGQRNLYNAAIRQGNQRVAATALRPAVETQIRKGTHVRGGLADDMAGGAVLNEIGRAYRRVSTSMTAEDRMAYRDAVREGNIARAARIVTSGIRRDNKIQGGMLVDRATGANTGARDEYLRWAGGGEAGFAGNNIDQVKEQNRRYWQQERERAPSSRDPWATPTRWTPWPGPMTMPSGRG